MGGIEGWCERLCVVLGQYGGKNDAVLQYNMLIDIPPV